MLIAGWSPAGHTLFRMDTRQIALQRAMSDEIVTRLGRMRKSAAWLQRETGMSPGSWRRYFVPDAISRDVPISVVMRVAEALGMSAGQLIGIAEETAPDFYAESLKGVTEKERAVVQAAQDGRHGSGPVAPERQTRRTGP